MRVLPPLILQHRLLRLRADAMTTNTALFMVQSPLHIINAREAIDKFAVTQATFLVVTSQHNTKWADMMIASLPDNTECIFVERNDFDLQGCTRDYAQHIPYLKKQNFDRVFFSDSRLYIFVDIVNSLQNANTYLMDDGTSTIQTVATLKHTGKYFDITQSSNVERRQQIEMVKKQFDLWQLPTVSYDLFSAFDFAPSEQFNLVENPMRALCCEHSALAEDQVLVLGQPFVSHQYMSAEIYCECLARIFRVYPAKSLRYFPHPRESNELLREIVHKFSVRLIESKLSAENYLIQQSEPPSIVCGFNSAALWYIAKFQPDIQVHAHRLKVSDISLTASKLMMRSSHLSIIDINQIIYDYFTSRMKVMAP